MRPEVSELREDLLFVLRLLSLELLVLGGTLEQLDGALLQVFFVEELHQEPERLRFIHREFENISNRNNKDRSDEDPPEADVHANDSSEERLGIDLSVASRTERNDHVPHAAVNRKEVLARLVTQRAFKDFKLVAKDEGGYDQSDDHARDGQLLGCALDGEHGAGLAAIHLADAVRPRVHEQGGIQVQLEQEVDSYEAEPEEDVVDFVLGGDFEIVVHLYVLDPI
mmetsp:Transcript_17666/g.27348  ORF Transcript_17666/g.27348 Transcript_17666/m.27348 type:complete len:225 (+) Transcript_17666:473-1147(+)